MFPTRLADYGTGPPDFEYIDLAWATFALGIRPPVPHHHLRSNEWT
jgi:hypothetical protein